MYFKKYLFIFCFGPRTPDDYLLYKTNEYYLAELLKLNYLYIIQFNF